MSPPRPELPSENKPPAARSAVSKGRSRTLEEAESGKQDPASKGSFRNFDRDGMPEPKSMKDPSMRGRLKRARDNRRRKRRRKAIIQGVSASLLSIVIVTLVVMTARNYALRQDGAGPKDVPEPVPAEAAEKTSAAVVSAPAPLSPRAVIPAITGPDSRDPEQRQISEARNRFLLRGAYEEAPVEKGSAGAPGASLSTSQATAGQERKISDEERKRMLERTLPYSTRTREKQQKRDVSPDDLYIPQAGGN